MAGSRVTARVTPNVVAKDLATVAANIAADVGVDTAVVVPSLGQPSTNLNHILVTSDENVDAATAKTNIDNSLAAADVQCSAYAYSPLVDSNDADDAVTISRAAGATVIALTATDPDQNPDNSLVATLTSVGGITGPVTLTSTGVAAWDLSIDLIAGDAAGPYNVVVEVVDKQGMVATYTVAVTSAA